jgi:hypothetical protein
LTLFALTDSNDITGRIDQLNQGTLERNVNPNPFVDVVSFPDTWAGSFELGGQRQASLLQSEWTLRIVFAGNHFVSLLLSRQNKEGIKAIIDASLKYHGPGTRVTTIDEHKAEFDRLLSIFAGTGPTDLTAFWAAGQPRSSQYETVLREMYPTYNTTSTGFLNYRPDLVIQPYQSCELSTSASDEDSIINESIRRNAVACEFTASKEFTLQIVQTYLNRKLNNYVEALQEQ